MKMGALFKYSLSLLIMILVTFLIITTYMYFISDKASMEGIYSFVAPISILITSFLYARNVHEKGLIRGVEIWLVYLAIILASKVLINSPMEINLLRNLIYLPISILGGVFGVNLKK